MSGQKVTKNLVATLVIQGLSWVLAFAVTLFLPRYIGDAGMGKLATAAALVTLCSILSNIATPDAVSREVARMPSRTGQTLAAALTVRLPLTILLGIVLPSLIAWNYPPSTRLLILISGCSVVVGALNDIAGGVLQGQENMTRPGLALLLDKFLATGLMLALVTLRAPLWMFAAVGVFTALCALGVNLRSIMGFVRQLQRPDMYVIRTFLAAGGTFFALMLFRTVYSQADVMLMSSLLPHDIAERTAGWYSVVQRLLGTALFIPTALATALLPTLTRVRSEAEQSTTSSAADEHNAQFSRLVNRSLNLTLMCATLISVPLIVMPEFILLRLLHYPETFRPSIPLLGIYGVGCIFWYATQILGTTLMALHKERAICRVSLWATLMTVIGCAVAIPLTHRLFGNAGIGAVCVDVAIEAYMTVCFFCLLPADVAPWRMVLSQFGRTLLAVVPLLTLLGLYANFAHTLGLNEAAGSLLYIAGIIGCILVGAGAYLWLCQCFGLFEKRDIDTLRQTLLARRNPKVKAPA